MVLWWPGAVTRKHQPPALPAGANRDVNLDVGETLQIEAWNADGTSSARYRGADLERLPDARVPSGPGMYRIVEVIGSRLVVEKL